MDMTLHVFTIATDEGRISALEDSARMSGVCINYLIKPAWRGYADKLFFAREFVQSVAEDDIACFIDAYDVLSLGPEPEIVAKFMEYGADLLIGAEINCFPARLAPAYPAVEVATTSRYVNSGGYIGYARAIREMLSWKADGEIAAICADGTDQAYVAEYYIARHCAKVRIDDRQRIFQNMHLVSWREIDIRQGRIHNTVLEETPCFVHFNGSSYQTGAGTDIRPVVLERLRTSRSVASALTLDDYDQILTRTCWPHPQMSIVNAYCPELRGDLVIGRVDDRVLAYDPEGRRMSLLNSSAAAVLDLCDGRHTVAQIIATLQRAVPAAARDIGAEVEEAIRRLAVNGLLTKAPSHNAMGRQSAQDRTCLSDRTPRWRALVCYLDESDVLIREGKALLESLIHIDAQDTDLVLFGPPAALRKFPDHPLVVKIPQQRHALAAEYGYINSLACLAGPGSEALAGYHYLLKTDLDVFLTPAWNSFRPEEFTVGRGGYSHTDTVRTKCRELAGRFGLNHYGKHNLGSTFYGPPGKVRDVCRLATMLCEHLLSDEFASEQGVWPHWYRGVASMYATEVAINHLVPELATTSSRLDAFSASREPVANCAHVHCWHTNGPFSKAEWHAGGYASVDIGQLDMGIVSDYCMAIAARVSDGRSREWSPRPGVFGHGDGPASSPGRASGPRTPKASIFPLSFCIPDEYVVGEPPPKSQVWAEVIPGEALTYRFGSEQEADYDAMYRNARFAFTTRKGGWDCLRHYEILAAGAIPVFRGLEDCPSQTLTTFPKALVIRAQRELLPWRPGNADKYDEIVRQLLVHTRAHCTASAAARRFLAHFRDRSVRRVLLLRTDPGPSYGRELLWIGLYRHLTALGGRALYYPENAFLFDDYPVEACERMHGAGFKYARKLERTQAQEWDDLRVRRSIESKAWDLVIYGKVGPDEGPMGTLPNLPFWDAVSANYGPSRTVFLYVGDAPQDLRSHNPHADHLRAHAPYAQCFVRELVL
jgi:hypothetical protein